jgi:uncharacterized protein YjiS (DUF1127 family)
MTTSPNPPNGRSYSPRPGVGLIGLVRLRIRRRRNLAELRALDAGRLEDIGLSEATRARITG